MNDKNPMAVIQDSEPNSFGVIRILIGFPCNGVHPCSVGF